MWCPQCQADVAAQVASDGQSLLCTTCNNPLKQIVAPSLHPETQSARDLLDKWASEEQGAETHDAESDEQSLEQQAKYRVDGSHTSPPGPSRQRPQRDRKKPAMAGPPAPAIEETDKPSAEDSPRIRKAEPMTQRRVDTGHAQRRGPHFDVTLLQKNSTKSGRAEIIWGQVLAYAGVGVLTVGTVMILWGYFGAIEQYASTGWLVSTAGQMLLLLGIVTLVGGGMQQTTHEVSERIEDLGGRILRIEDSTDRILEKQETDRKAA